MKKNIALLTIALLVISSCGGMKKSRKNTTSEPVVIEEIQATADTVMAPVPVPEPEIIEVEEKLVEVPEVPVAVHQYFVIIGSFKNVNNANNFQEQVKKDGFKPVLLQNEAGLYRVSVMSTDDVGTARTEILRIRTQFKKYADTWLLIRIK